MKNKNIRKNFKLNKRYPEKLVFVLLLFMQYIYKTNQFKKKILKNL